VKGIFPRNCFKKTKTFLSVNMVMLPQRQQSLSMMKIRRIQKVLLYNEGTPENLNIEGIAEYLREKLSGIPAGRRESSPVSCHENYLHYAKKLASIKILDVRCELTSRQEPSYGEVQYEQRRLLGKTRAFGVLYDGFHLQRIFAGLIARDERGLEFVHIFLTNRLFATWDEADRRYHARTSVYGIPSVISTTGLVEAPARPREYYLLKQQYELMGKDPLELKERFKGRFIDYEDECLTEVVKGYVMQGVFYHLVGNPFCADKGCRLYNAHWQEELIFAQLGSRYEFCGQHARILDDLPNIEKGK
jgi:hypothetical protein